MNWDVFEERICLEFITSKLELDDLYKHVYLENDTKCFDDIWYLMSQLEQFLRIYFRN